MSTGLYRLYWMTGGSSLAAVGAMHDGQLWFAPTNWTADDARRIVSTDWDMVKRAELLVRGGWRLAPGRDAGAGGPSRIRTEE